MVICSIFEKVNSGFGDMIQKKQSKKDKEAREGQRVLVNEAPPALLISKQWHAMLPLCASQKKGRLMKDRAPRKQSRYKYSASVSKFRVI